jgi:hypothetical protein
LDLNAITGSGSGFGRFLLNASERGSNAEPMLTDWAVKMNENVPIRNTLFLNNPRCMSQHPSTFLRLCSRWLTYLQVIDAPSITECIPS